MIEPTPSPADPFVRAVVRIASPAAAVFVLSACGLMGALGNDPQVVGYVYRQEMSYVRLERIEAGAPDNSHPFAVSAEALTQALAGLQAEGSNSITASPVFNEAELKEIVPHLVAALAKAGPKEDIGFAVTGRHGLLGSFASPSITTGRLFATDRRLNVILGLVQELYESEEFKANSGSLPAASRTYRAGRVWKLVPKSGQLIDRRPDWVTYDLPAPAKKTGDAGRAPVAPGADSRYQEIQTRLMVINRLKENGLITEEEYQERRRAILQAL
jgi:hypothetical protein